MYLTQDKIVGDRIKIELVDIGEGYCGDYDPRDPNDAPLLRFDVYVRDRINKSWEVPDGSSYCTQIPVATPAKRKKEILLRMHEELTRTINSNGSIKKTCERLSWETG